ncbi:MAG: hypothetical protein K0R14_1919 [Burkholderiales bacterium]|jgi:hypothetical protein|nr:hypothetical protein [Burkholderiales bacterium]
MTRKKSPTKQFGFKKQLLWFIGIYVISLLVYAGVSMVIHFIIVLLR